jgi:hypothetical protein
MNSFSEFTPYPEDPRYGVTRDGRVARIEKVATWPIGLVAPHTTPDGYLAVHINYKRHRVNRIVATTFIPNPENKPEVAHDDNDQTNNRVENLKWATRQENEDDKLRFGTRPTCEEHGMAKLTNEDVKDIRQQFAGKIPFSPPFYTDAAATYGVSHQMIMNIVKGRNWKNVASAS